MRLRIPSETQTFQTNSPAPGGHSRAPTRQSGAPAPQTQRACNVHQPMAGVCACACATVTRVVVGCVNRKRSTRIHTHTHTCMHSLAVRAVRAYARCHNPNFAIHDDHDDDDEECSTHTHTHLCERTSQKRNYRMRTNACMHACTHTYARYARCSVLGARCVSRFWSTLLVGARVAGARN